MRAALFLCLTAISIIANAEAFCYVDKFQPTGADWIGEDVAISKDFMAFSASASDDIFILRRKTDGSGYLKKQLSGFDTVSELQIHGNHVVAVGAADEVYLINVGNKFEVMSVPQTGANSAYLKDDLLVIGSAYESDPGGFANGYAVIYRWKYGTWQFEARIQNSDNNDFDIFGAKVFIDKEGKILVGAIGAQNSGVRSGAVYTFTYTEDEWVETRKRFWYTSEELDFFGQDIVVSPNGATINIAAPGAETVWVFDYWDLKVEALYMFDEQNTEFGASIDANNQYMVIGAPYAGQNDKGKVHVYEWDGILWFYIGSIAAPDGFPIDEFGRSVAISEDNQVIIGAPLHPNEFGPGAVYLYRIAASCP